MGCYQDLEPSVDNESGLDAIPVRRILLKDEIGSVRKVEIAEERSSKVDPEAVATDLQQRIFRLYGEFRPRLHRYLHSMRLKPDVVEEIIQETFLRLTT